MSREQKRWTGPDAEYIVPLYRLAMSHNVDNERIAEWMAINGLRYSNQMVKRTLKMAKREDLIDYLIKEEDIKIGDTVKSRMTGRIGDVSQIRPDGDTIVVRWDTGGSQPLSKESVFKLKSKESEITDNKDFKKVHNHSDDTYKVMNEKKLFERKPE
jgi:hypothetical protein